MDKVLEVIGSMNRAGAETMLMNAYRAMDRSNLQLDFLVYSERKQDYEDEIEQLGGKVIHLSNCSIWNYTSKIDKVIIDNGPYVAIHAHTLYNSAFAVLAAMKHPDMLRIVHSHNTRNDVDFNFAKYIYERLSVFIIRRFSQKWLACGTEAGKYLFGKKFDKQGIVINNAVDLESFKENKINCEKIKSDLCLEDKVVIGSVARLMEVKNHRFMISIAEKLKENKIPFKMLFVGKGPLLTELQSIVSEKNLDEDVLFLGLRTDIPDLMHAFDVLLMPSLFEGNPVTLVEAQASGLPCVISSNISSGIDMDLGLIQKCNLDDEIQVWINSILLSKEKKIFDREVIKQAFNCKRYDAESTACTLRTIYLSGRTQNE